MDPSILVVDDEPVMQEVLKLLLANKGYVAQTCFEGKGALKAMTDLEFNLVILDLNLPDCHGREIAEFIDDNHPNTPIIFITGGVNAEALSLELECKDRLDRQFLYKPITSDALYGAMDNLIQVSLEKGHS